MKRLAVTVLVALMLASCQEAPKGYVINGEVTGRTEGKVYLKSFRNKMFFDVDTAELKEGKFTFKGEVDQPLLFGLATEDMSYPVQFFVENTNMDVRISNDGETITVRNSPVNTIFQENAEKVFEEGYDIDSLITKYPASPAAAFYLYRYFTYQLPLDELKATRAKISSELAGCPYVKDLDGIIKQLENKKIVLCDRFIDSSLAYQGIARGIGLKEVWDINQFAIDGCMPEKTLFLSVSVETGKKRMNLRGDLNRLDQEESSFHKAVRQGYEALVSMYPERIEVIDAEPCKEEVLKSAMECVLKVIKEHE